MQRIRMSLPYFKEFGWEPTIVTVQPRFSEIIKDDLLVLSLPPELMIYQVNAFDKKITSKFGLGSLALRSFWFYFRKVNQILRTEKYDLVYFSTTEFPLCVLGAYWKRRFGLPYVIDMQDPWHSEYYQDKPRNQKPPKYWFSYRLNKFLEPIGMKHVGGLISVSQNYIDDLKLRYPTIDNIPAETITFGAFNPDIEIAATHHQKFIDLLDPTTINLVYIGRGGNDMHRALSKLFGAFKMGLTDEPNTFRKIRMYFIGTSYAPPGKGQQTIIPLSKNFGIQDYVVEVTNRISYFHTLLTLKHADALFIPGSDDPKYTASKIYPYLLVRKPLLAIFNPESSTIRILKEYGVECVFDFVTASDKDILNFLRQVAEGGLAPDDYAQDAIKKYSAFTMTEKQCAVFDRVINGKN